APARRKPKARPQAPAPRPCRCLGNHARPRSPASPSPLPPLRSASAAVLRHRAAAAAAAEDDPLRIAVQILDGAIEIGKGAPAVDSQLFPFAQARSAETHPPRANV